MSIAGPPTDRRRARLGVRSRPLRAVTVVNLADQAGVSSDGPQPRSAATRRIASGSSR